MAIALLMYREPEKCICLCGSNYNALALLQSAYTRPGSSYEIKIPTQIRKRSLMDSTAMAACLSGDVLASAETD